jgi:hypothetical protein
VVEQSDQWGFGKDLVSATRRGQSLPLLVLDPLSTCDFITYSGGAGVEFVVDLICGGVWRR